MTKIGKAKDVLAQAVNEEFGDFRARLGTLSETASEIARDSAGINGVSSFWRGLHQQLDAMADTVDEKQTDVLAALAGKPKHEIHARVNPEQAERVRSAREEAA